MDSTLTSYQPGTAICDRYLSLNGITGVAVWRDPADGDLFRVAQTTDEDGTEGLPNHGPALTFATCDEYGRKLAERYGLQYHGLVN